MFIFPLIRIPYWREIGGNAAGQAFCTATYKCEGEAKRLVKARSYFESFSYKLKETMVLGAA